MHIRHLSLLLSLAVSALLTGCTINASLFGSGRAALAEVTIDGAGDDKCLLISVEGTISSSDSRSLMGGSSNSVDDLRRQLAKASSDDSIRAVILRVNSPGGGATASDTMYHELKTFREKTKIPVVAFFQDVAASGGYYISMAANEIVAQPTTITGSIGVIAVFMDMTGTLEKIGAKAHVLRSSKFKASTNPLIEKSAEDLKHGQELIDAMYTQFASVVEKGRPALSGEKLKAVADGRVFMGEDAKRLGLVDHVGYFALAKERAEALAARGKLKLVAYSTTTSDPDRTYYTSASVTDAPPAALEFPAATALAERLGLNSTGSAFLYYWSP